MNDPKEHPSWTYLLRQKVVIVALVIVLVVGIAIGWLVGGAFSSHTQPEVIVTSTETVTVPASPMTPTATPSPSATPQGTATPQPTASPSPGTSSPSPGADTSASKTTRLADLSTVDSGGCSAWSWMNKTATLSKTVYTDAKACEMNARSQNVGDNGYLDYIVPVGVTTFQATVGQDDNSTSTDVTTRFEVLDLEGNSLWSADMTYGHTTDVNVDVSTILRVRLKVTVLVAAQSPPSQVTVVWANPQFA